MLSPDQLPDEVVGTTQQATSSTTPSPPQPPSTADTSIPATATTITSATTNAASTIAKRGNKYFVVELLNFLGIMERVLPIGPDEWAKVLDEHSTSYPGRDVESLRRKYTNLHRKKVPTGDPNCPPEIALAKKVKYMIGDKAQIGDGHLEYDMLNNRFEGAGEGDEPVPTVIAATSPVRARDDVSFASQTASPPATMNHSGLMARNRPSGRNDMMNFMMMQMQTEAKEREYDRKERAEDRRQMTNMITTIASGYFQSVNKNKKRKKRNKRKIKKRKYNNDINGKKSSHSSEDDSSSSSSSSSSDSSSD